MGHGPETLGLEDGHLRGDFNIQRQNDPTGHLMAERSERSSDGEPDKGEPKIKAVPGDPEFVAYLDSVEW